MKAARMNTGKPEMDFVLDFPIAVEAICRVMELGAVKYARDNWKLGGKPDSEYLGAALRHLFAHRSGDLVAEDSGCLHVAHAAWNLLALMELNIQKTHDPAVLELQKANWAETKKPKPLSTELPADFPREF